MAYWNWESSVFEYIKFAITLLSAKWVFERIYQLNNSFTQEIPVGWILLIIISVFLLYQVLWLLKWTNIWLKQRWKPEWLIIHWGIYLIIVSVIFSMNTSAMVLPSDISSKSMVDSIKTQIPEILQELAITPTSNPTITISDKFTPKITPAPTPTSIPTPIPTPKINIYETNPKTVTLNYKLHGNNGKISFIVYGGLNNYLKNQPRSMYGNPTDLDFIMKDLNDEEQDTYLKPLVYKIQNITSNEGDQAKIAISLVQNIEYDWDGFKTGVITGKYPYEVLYTLSGVCGEKTELLAYMLREIGYEVAIFRFDVESHDAIGIKCPQQYSYRNSGYCFVESTTPNIITDSSGDYVGVGKLKSEPNILKISGGISLDSVSEEYNDAISLNQIYGLGSTLDESNYNRWVSLTNKYGIKSTG